MADERRFVVSVERVVDAAPAAIFALLSDPERHVDIDGSGTVRAVEASTLPLSVGSHFDMVMKRGFDYSTRNEIIALEPDRLIAWRTCPLTPPLSERIGGRTWTYELTPEGDGTRVRETWDLRDERHRDEVYEKAGDPTDDMTATLARIAELVGASS